MSHNSSSESLDGLNFEVFEPSPTSDSHCNSEIKSKRIMNKVSHSATANLPSPTQIPYLYSKPTTTSTCKLVSAVPEKSHSFNSIDCEDPTAILPTEMLGDIKTPHLEDNHSSVIGLAKLPYQKRKRAERNGMNFTVMLVGESGLGKTTFLNTLFDSDILPIRKLNVPQLGNVMKTTQIEYHKMRLDEDGFVLDFTVIDTPGFSDYINNNYCWVPISNFIDEQFRRYIFQESQPQREKMQSTQVHACLYFIKPNLRGLSDLDIKVMKELSSRVNLIPIISKADAFNSTEMGYFKESIRNTLCNEGINLCKLLADEGMENSILDTLPLSVIGSSSRVVNSLGNIVRGRSYKWGTVEVENEDHCDFIKLRSMLLSNNMLDLVKSTEKYYEKYRSKLMRNQVVNIIKQGSEALNEQRGDDISAESDMEELVEQRLRDENPLETLKYLCDNRPEFDKQYDNTLKHNLIYKESVRIFKKQFSHLIQQQDSKFKGWKRHLFDKQSEFNHSIESIHNQILEMRQSLELFEGSQTIIDSSILPRGDEA
ncbi:BA75_04414T0 [Komagataella pastoris]|uniref:BA75_04414T0 n=1 Tax=Komagataella pastoris TaxID=4922 RepID=A0A1B2JGZ3_PICPA|nr:BA75_04414T0 [Komagataella pastoris]